MNIELLLFWKSRKLKPLKPAKITSSPPTTDRIADHPAAQPYCVDRDADHQDRQRKPEHGVDDQLARAMS